MENTEAASVEPITAPTSKPSSQGIPNAKWQNTPVIPAVMITPATESHMPGLAAVLAVFQLVSKPPENMMNNSATEQVLSAME